MLPSTRRYTGWRQNFFTLTVGQTVTALSEADGQQSKLLRVTNYVWQIFRKRLERDWPIGDGLSGVCKPVFCFQTAKTSATMHNFQRNTLIIIITVLFRQIFPKMLKTTTNFMEVGLSLLA